MAPPSPLLAVLSKCNSQPINGQCINFILFDLAQLPLNSKIADVDPQEFFTDISPFFCVVYQPCGTEYDQRVLTVPGGNSAVTVVDECRLASRSEVSVCRRTTQQASTERQRLATYCNKRR